MNMAYRSFLEEIKPCCEHWISSSEDLFKMIDPKVALISVGKNNRYRHPSYLTLKRLEAYGVKIYRSDLQGMVKIVYYVGKNYVMTSSGF